MLTQSVLPVLPPKTIYYDLLKIMSEGNNAQKTIVIGAGPVGALAALYAAQRGHDVEVYELRSGTFSCLLICLWKHFDIHPSFESWDSSHIVECLWNHIVFLVPRNLPFQASFEPLKCKLATRLNLSRKISTTDLSMISNCRNCALLLHWFLYFQFIFVSAGSIIDFPF